MSRKDKGLHRKKSETEFQTGIGIGIVGIEMKGKEKGGKTKTKAEQPKKKNKGDKTTRGCGDDAMADLAPMEHGRKSSYVLYHSTTRSDLCLCVVQTPSFVAPLSFFVSSYRSTVGHCLQYRLVLNEGSFASSPGVCVLAHPIAIVNNGTSTSPHWLPWCMHALQGCAQFVFLCLCLCFCGVNVP